MSYISGGHSNSGHSKSRVVRGRKRGSRQLSGSAKLSYFKQLMIRTRESQSDKVRQTIQTLPASLPRNSRNHISLTH